MRSFSNKIVDGLRSRGHNIREITAPVCIGRLINKKSKFAKWFYYIDQFLIFRIQLWWIARNLPPRTLCVFTDQALSPWIPPFINQPHIVHVHDLLSLEAAQGGQPYLRLALSGRFYQRWIRDCFRKAKCFVSVSYATRNALTQQLDRTPLINEVLLNPLSSRFSTCQSNHAGKIYCFCNSCTWINTVFFHIGRNWYKNRLGLLEIWEQAFSVSSPHDLVLVGSLEPPLMRWLDMRPQLKSHLHVLDSPSDELVVSFYKHAALLLYPSHAEGFGWPVLEALACGCPVVTTDLQPMTEVGGDCATYIPPAPLEVSARREWAKSAAMHVATVLVRPDLHKQSSCIQGVSWANSFNEDSWLNQLEVFYSRVLDLQGPISC